jgi:glycosyltransferase involved in cell wall biosynthesis
MPKVSVIIPTYNAEKFISETIASVMTQTYPDWEIIAVDDGSIDRTPEILRKYAEKFPQKIRVIVQKNSGVSVARNTGIAASKGEYLAFLDHDDLWLPEKLERQVDLLDANKELGLVYSDSYIIDEKGELKGTFIHSIMSKNIIRCEKFRGNIFNELFCVDFIPLLTVVVRKEVLKRVGNFDPKYKISEDYDLFLKIAQIYPVDFIDQPLAKYRMHSGGASKNLETRIKEDLQIMEYWLNKKPELKKELGYKIKLKKATLYGSLSKYYFGKINFKKAAKETKNLIKSLIF